MPGNAEQASPGDYQLLGLPYGAPPEAVKKAYKTFVKTWHPDRFPQGSTRQRQAEDRLKAVTAAYRRIRSQWGAERVESQPEPAPPRGNRRRPVSTRPGAPDSFLAFPWRRLGAQIRSLRLPFSLARAWPGLLLLVLALLAFQIELDPSSPPKPPPGPASSQNPIPPSAVAPIPSPSPVPVAAPPSDSPAPSSLTPAKHPDPRPPVPASAPDSPARTFFTLGSTKAEVLRVQGRPGKVHGQKWVYGLSEVTFKDGRVWRYNNFDGGLKVKILPAEPLTDGQAASSFGLGATRDEVLRVQGTPTHVNGNKWSYGFSEVHFKDGVVTGYNNFFKKLRVAMQPSQGAETAVRKGYFTIGSSRDEVIALQGTPTMVQGNLWSYELSDILFVDGKVRSVTDSSGLLKYVPPDSLAEQ